MDLMVVGELIALSAVAIGVYQVKRSTPKSVVQSGSARAYPMFHPDFPSTHFKSNSQPVWDCSNYRWFEDFEPDEEDDFEDDE